MLVESPYIKSSQINFRPMLVNRYWTLEMWVKIVGIGGTTGHLTLFSYSQRRVGGCGVHVHSELYEEDVCADEVFWIGLNYPSDLIVKMPSQPYAAAGEAADAYYYAAAPLFTGGWHHLALTASPGTAGHSVLKVFLDGSEWSSESRVTPNLPPPGNVGSVIFGQGHGNYLQNSLHHMIKHYTPGLVYNVSMTEVRLWSVARNAEIATFRHARWRPTPSISRLLTDQDMFSSW